MLKPIFDEAEYKKSKNNDLLKSYQEKVQYLENENKRLNKELSDLKKDFNFVGDKIK